MKTVTVEVALPEGWEARNPPPQPVPARIFDGTRAAVTVCIDVRPIAQEKTWERPEWLGDGYEYITHSTDSGFMVWVGTPELNKAGDWICRSAKGSGCNAVRIKHLPTFCDLPPAARIWRIVERGEG